jgi:hypothetical protein
MSQIEFEGFAITWDEEGKPHRVEAKRVPSSGRHIEPDPRVMREAREKLRKHQNGSDSSNPEAA